MVASTLSFSDKKTVTRSSKVRSLQLIGDEAALTSDADVGEQLLPPGSGEDVDLQHRVDREARRTSRVLEATGTVRGTCYAGVLVPFHPVQVKLGTTAASGTYLIQRVTHQLGRSEYRQEVHARSSDSLSGTGGGSGLIRGGLFGRTIERSSCPLPSPSTSTTGSTARSAGSSTPSARASWA